MSAPDRSWTIAPTLLWFCGAIGVGLYALDGDVGALASRLTTPRADHGATAAAGPAFAAKPATVVDPTDDDNDHDDGATAPPRPVVDTGDRARVAALEDVCLQGTPNACTRWGLDPFYAAYRASKAGALGRALRVSWYGDSVVATDAIPGRLRMRLQGELGDGGPGFLYVVPPHRFCHHEAITRSVEGTWAPYAVSTTTVPDGFYGPGGASAETTGGGATIKLVRGRARELELYYLAQPRGGTAIVTADKAEVIRVSTAAEHKQPGHARVSIASGAAKFELATEGRVRLFGLAVENPGGAVVDNLGIVSVTAKNFATRAPDHFAAELAHRGADLLVVMIGANEAQWLQPGDRDTKDYQARYERALAPLRQGRPDGACLVVSPLDQAQAEGDAYPSRPVMPLLVDAQRKAAHAQGCAFYATYDWMGGKGSAAKWYAKGLVGSDFQHLSRKGANKMADAVYEALVAGLQRYAK